jgi:hypothetical protein
LRHKHGKKDACNLYDWIVYIMDLEILVVLVTRLLRRDLDKLVNGMEPVELWDEG